MMKILWLSPTFNHYKARFLNHLAKENDIKLCIIAGTGRQGQGDKPLTEQWNFDLVNVDENKRNFGFSKKVRNTLKKWFDNYDWVLVPAEKKNLLLFLYAIYLRKKAKQSGKTVRLFSYNHPILKSSDGKNSFINKVITRFFYQYLDRVIFYTETSCKWAVENELIIKSKAFWANNTLDDTEIKKHYQFSYPPKDDRRILFIGRLIPSKKIHVAIEYFKQLKKKFDETDQSIRLEIIGDGPDAHFVKEAAKEDTAIIWHGTLTDEKEIAPVMKRSSLVFVPGLSGLSVNHALLYGRPYVTISSQFHGPEISYLQHGVNGFLLTGSEEKDVNDLYKFLVDKEQIEKFCDSAYSKSKEITIDRWVEQMKKALVL